MNSVGRFHREANLFFELVVIRLKPVICNWAAFPSGVFHLCSVRRLLVFLDYWQVFENNLES